ncbi:penicillin-binding protein 1A [Arboricoccus pini]|uniref:Penicillin-binding protein 1A n=1 Tax=Arboricoccus pini TaxID=1963835 RepID=A0A212R5E3_9PROT|nr:penicillin-binding protein 1A [Arboricoccus pini]SNB67252.1 penicillin-binding protein 1A [Arboricoccus pini]
MAPVVRFLILWLSRLALGCFGLALVGAGILAYVIYYYGKDLPDLQSLASYEPPTVTRVHAGDGRLLAEYARERRIYVPADAMPAYVKEAFVAAEDQNFYSNYGIDLTGMVRASITNVERLMSGRRPQGASTITQQVAKNFLLSNELSISRKIKEAILALRMERVYSKDHILELYLNEIYLGNRSYGVAAAALNYFDKSLDELTVAEAAFLGGLPQAPSRYDPTRNPDAALNRRTYVIGRMLEDGYITKAQAEEAAKEPLNLRPRRSREGARADFFTEEVRRQLVGIYGEAGFYEGGLSVRTTVQPKVQRMADHALRDGLFTLDTRANGWRGPVGHLDLGSTPDWAAAVDSFDAGFELMDWQAAVVLDTKGDAATIGLEDGSKSSLSFADMRWARPRDDNGHLGASPRSVRDVLKVGDLIVVEHEGEGANAHWSLRQRPLIEGALVALDPNTGQVLALTGGFSFRQSWFNRATQAWRQPGSSFKPFVYLAGLESGMTPSTIILDAPVSVYQGPGLPLWQPENFERSFYGPATLRLGLEKSRNLMTVRLAQQIGMEKVRDVAHRFGVDHKLGLNLAAALGSNEVTPLSMAAAYGMIVNGGHKIEPYLIERIQDRHGRTIMKRDHRTCEQCLAASWDNGLPPDVPDDRPQVEDPRIAYQMVSLLQGVIERGTGRAANALGRPLGGKTGTTNDSKDGWFVGFSPDLVAAVYVGYDQPRSLGSRAQGATVALPIWMDFMGNALKDVPPAPFRTPPGLQFVNVDATTGRLPGDNTQNIIREAFLPGTDPGHHSQPIVGNFTTTTGDGGPDVNQGSGDADGTDGGDGGVGSGGNGGAASDPHAPSIGGLY